MPGKILRVAAWSMLLLVMVGYMTEIPPIDQWLEKSFAGQAATKVILLAAFLDMMALWFSAVWYAWRRCKDRNGPFWAVFALLLTNFVGGFFYYFLFARKHMARGFDYPLALVNRAEQR